VALIPVLGFTGWLFPTVGVDGEAGLWMTLGAAVVWIALMIWWALLAPPQLTEEHRGRYLAFLRHAEYEPLDQSDAAARRERR
jgi:hypothetical protein